MIFGHISTVAADVPHLHKILVKGLEYLVKNDLAALPTGKYEIEGKDIYVAINEYETQPREARRAEAHADYLDIQYIISGQEMVAYSLLAANNEVLADELAANDVIFYKTVQQETDLAMTEGMYAIFFPWDVHRPNCILNKAASVKKAVVKIKMSLLK
ncbi:YhcH/YjgK/YiaL family protein [Sporomusa sp. KB1]|jgi:YhcH/YjgK/YiaL family protein|uniref:YhcH/YjgK/YiaL family protein n=1 Tax=Sporomusa sp. KB1 TaxID=943346 RepID=UPI0011A92785|nr:YhcH/YjgK/YiaL family protein [Sporomusa sp. KB1]TWH47847.1 YhcH/YjgK/YiaL family protein [Sporomusa sp. KB1]